MSPYILDDTLSKPQQSAAAQSRKTHCFTESVSFTLLFVLSIALSQYFNTKKRRVEFSVALFQDVLLATGERTADADVQFARTVWNVRQSTVSGLGSEGFQPED